MHYQNNGAGVSPAPAPRKSIALLICALLCLLAAYRSPAQTGRLTVRADQPGVKISPLFYGLMTEEINHSYDGGLYAELVQNRAFLDNGQNPSHWSVVQPDGAMATMALDKSQPLSAALPVALRVEVTTASRAAMAGVANDGYWGIPVKPQTSYRA